VTFAFDTYTMNYHGFFFSHMDALSHCFWDHKLYNGVSPDVVTNDGAQKLDIAAFKDGILTRGVLMDIPKLKGVPYLEPDTLIYPEDLDEWEKKAHLKVASGDMLFLRTGRWACRAAKGPWNIGRSSAGLYATCVKWLKERDISVLASDTGSDVVPSRIEGVGNPIHALVLVALGTPIFDNLDLEAVSETCSKMNRWEFMATAAPMVIPKGTGSPLNPIATF
jgi:kynurenine formamidase